MHYSTVVAGGDKPRPDGRHRRGIDGDTADAVLIVTPPRRGIDCDTVGAGFIPALTPALPPPSPHKTYQKYGHGLLGLPPRGIGRG